MLRESADGIRVALRTPGLAALLLLVFNNVLGGIAHAASPSLAMITCASAISACALAALLVPAIRNARPPHAT